MTFTLWMDGEQIGETQFEHHRGRERIGVFFPTIYGLQRMPQLTGMMAALADVARACASRGLSVRQLATDQLDAGLAVVESTPEGERLLEQARVMRTVEIRNDEGQLLPWLSLTITDLSDVIGIHDRLADVPDDRTEHELMVLDAEADEFADSMSDVDDAQYMVTASFPPANARRTLRFRGPGNHLVS